MQEVKKLEEVISPAQSFLILSTKEAHVKYLGEVISPAQSFLISANCFKSRFVSSASLICARAASRLTTVVFLVSSLFTLAASLLLRKGVSSILVIFSSSGVSAMNLLAQTHTQVKSLDQHRSSHFCSARNTDQLIN